MADIGTPLAWTRPVTLTGRRLRLVPMQPAHADGLRAAVADGALWRRWYTAVPTPDGVDAYIATALAGQAAATDLPFVVCAPDGTVLGSTRYCHIDAANQRLEIGYTWYAQRVQRTGLNTEAKRLLLGHAFDDLGAIAVEFRTAWFNHRSREAILRLGAKQDGVLRNAQRNPGGGYRDTVVYSIIDSEWPVVKCNLDQILANDGRRP